uniref:Family with sequence similarity 98 member B n=1 Tax=Mus spicilegus TaxID=10103 RepID=A0A8C6H7R3_MUSSI
MRGPELGPETSMEGDVLDTLEALGYKGPLLEEQALSKAAEGGLSSPEFSELCIWLGSQIKSLCNLEESITSAGRDDLESFQLEISGFLKEMACPYSVLVSGDIKERLTKKDDCLKLLLFLSTELQALQILQKKKHKNSQLDKNSEICQEVQAVCDALGVPKSDTSDIPLLLSQVESKVKDILSRVQKNHVGKPLLKVDLSSEQAEKLERINDALSCEYECRRRMLMKRLDVTVQSFGWSDRAKVRLLSHWCPVGGSVGQLLPGFLCCRYLGPVTLYSNLHVQLPVLFHTMILVSYRSMFADDFFPGFHLPFNLHGLIYTSA